MGEEKPLRTIAAAFEPLADVATRGGAMEVGPFSHACAHVKVLFGCLGIAFKFAEQDYVAKVDDLTEASESYSTLNDMIEAYIHQDCVRRVGSHSRNLLRVIRAIDMARVLCEKIIELDGNSLIDAGSEAYAKVFAPHHGLNIRNLVAIGMIVLPSKSHFFQMLNEDEGSAKVQMQSFVGTSRPVIKYIEELFNSRQLGIDW